MQNTPNPISLNNLRMHVIATDEGGEVNADTIFEFIQDDRFISARYAGGKVRLGYLVGTVNGAQGEFRYCQVDYEGKSDGGYSTFELGRSAEGKIRLYEHFQWASREGTGINVFEEV